MIKLQDGYSLVEVLVTTVVIAILITIIAGFSVNSFFNYSINAARANLLADTNLAIDIINSDVRLSANVDLNNRWEDANAPGAPDNELSWESTEDVLVLATAASDSDGDLLFVDASNYITEKNNHIYYVQDGQLLRRIITSSSPENGASTTCPPSVADATCPADSVFAENVQNFTVSYIDRAGNVTTPDEARAVEVSLELAAERFGRTISVSQDTRMVFRNE